MYSFLKIGIDSDIEVTYNNEIFRIKVTEWKHYKLFRSILMRLFRRYISKVLEKQGHIVRSTDVVDRGFGKIKDFLFFNDDKFDGDIITNPPYAYAQEFVEKALEVIPEGNKVAMLLRIQFLEGKRRKKLFEKHPPKYVYVFSERIKCAKNGEFENSGSSAQAFCWFVWVKGYKGETIVRWI